jgi:hypothetical protein
MAEQPGWQSTLVFRSPGSSRATVRRHYEQYRASQGLPRRCDNETCTFYNGPLVWNGRELPLILDHVNGVARDNQPGNLRYLCPNCDAQLPTRGGKNKGRVQYGDGHYSYNHRGGRRDATVFAVPAAATATVLPMEPEGKHSESKSGAAEQGDEADER